jgi:hypothetical protein
MMPGLVEMHYAWWNKEPKNIIVQVAIIEKGIVKDILSGYKFYYKD